MYSDDDMQANSYMMITQTPLSWFFFSLFDILLYLRHQKVVCYLKLGVCHEDVIILSKTTLDLRVPIYMAKFRTWVLLELNAQDVQFLMQLIGSKYWANGNYMRYKKRTLIPIQFFFGGSTKVNMWHLAHKCVLGYWVTRVTFLPNLEVLLIVHCSWLIYTVGADMTERYLFLVLFLLIWAGILDYLWFPLPICWCMLHQVLCIEDK